MMPETRPKQDSKSISIQIWLWGACVFFALYLGIADHRWGSDQVLGSTVSHGSGGPNGPYFIFVKTPDGKEHMFEVAKWELDRFRADVPVLLDVRRGTPTIHRPFGNWYFRTFLWMQWSAKQWFSGGKK